VLLASLEFHFFFFKIHYADLDYREDI
jgi:hypothetical protein